MRILACLCLLALAVWAAPIDEPISGDLTGFNETEPVEFNAAGTEESPAVDGEGQDVQSSASNQTVAIEEFDEERTAEGIIELQPEDSTTTTTTEEPIAEVEVVDNGNASTILLETNEPVVIEIEPVETDPIPATEPTTEEQATTTTVAAEEVETTTLAAEEVETTTLTAEEVETTTLAAEELLEEDNNSTFTGDESDAFNQTNPDQEVPEFSSEFVQMELCTDNFSPMGEAYTQEEMPYDLECRTAPDDSSIIYGKI